jgi:hypothetical protein
MKKADEAEISIGGRFIGIFLVNSGFFSEMGGEKRTWPSASFPNPKFDVFFQGLLQKGIVMQPDHWKVEGLGDTFGNDFRMFVNDHRRRANAQYVQLRDKD